MSSLAPLKWNDEVESQQKSTIENLCEKLIIGTMTTKSLWFAFADPSILKPQINLIHLDKVAQVLCFFGIIFGFMLEFEPGDRPGFWILYHGNLVILIRF